MNKEENAYNHPKIRFSPTFDEFTALDAYLLDFDDKSKTGKGLEDNFIDNFSNDEKQL